MEARRIFEGRGRGFSLVELCIALGLVAIVILTVALLALSILRSTTESNDRGATTPVAATIFSREMAAAQADPQFWANDYVGTPYTTGTLQSGDIEYKYELFAATVVDAAGDPVGYQLPNNRLKQVELRLTWFDTASKERQGYGKLEVVQTRLVSEEVTP